MMRQMIRRYGRKLMAFVLCLFLVSTSLQIVDGAETSGNQTVKAGIFHFDGYHMKDAKGNLTGYGIGFLELVSKYSHLNFGYVGYDKTWDEMLVMLDHGEIDVVTSVKKTPEREERYAFSLPIGTNETVLTAQAGNTRLKAGDHRSYEGMTVGILIGSGQDQELADFAKEKGFSYKTLGFKDPSELAAALQDGRIDAALSSSLRKAKNERVLDTIASDNFYAIVRKEDTKLLDEIDYAIEQMDINEGDWANVLFYQYYGPVNPSALTFTEREKAYIQAVISGEKTITMTAIGDRKPYSYVEEGKLKGILPDYFAEVMELAGLPYETVLSGDRAEYYALADHNQVDVVIDRRSSHATTAEDLYRGFYTDTYMTTGVAKVTRKDAAGEIRVVAAAKEQGGDPIEQGLTDEIEILELPTREEALQAVLEGRADAAFVHTYTAQLFVDEDYTDSLQYSMVNNVRYGFRMYVRDSCDHELVTILDKCIHQMPGDALSQLITQYTSATPEDMTFARYIKANPQVMPILFLALALVTWLILALFLRNRWNQKIIDATEQSKNKLEEQLAIVDALSRDYLNVYAVDAETAIARIIKLNGYVTAGLDRERKEGFPYTVFLQQYIRDRVYHEDQPYLMEVLSLDNIKKRLEEDTDFTGSYHVSIDGELHDFQFTYIKMEGGGHEKDSFILAGFRNIDEMVRKEQEQKEILAVALEEARRANIAKTTFLNNMSHDMRTPMNAILGFTSLAVSHIDNKEQVLDYLGKIMTSSNHLLRLINDVLDMSRIESGKVKIETKEASLSQILEDLKAILQSDIKAKQLAFSMDTVDLTDDTVICDKLRLEQVLLNILSNAVKYTKPGGSIRFLVTQIKGREPDEGFAFYRFQIRDTGIGMSKSFLKHLFEPFEREETATKSGILGTGLGLAITKSIVDRMDGTITVDSEVGKGTEFIVTFRFQVADHMGEKDAQTGRDAKEAEKGAGAIKAGGAGTAKEGQLLTGKRILLVEDNELNQEIAKTILEEAGFIIDTADDGTVAVEKMEAAAQDAYDLILMDIQMPVMDGYRATRAIREMADPVKASIPIVAMTANAFEEDRQRAAEAGMDGHVAKPIDIERLMETLKELLLQNERFG